MFPLSGPDEFGSTPYLISSRPPGNKQLSTHLGVESSTWLTGDSFYLMTDAVAAWFARRTIELAKPWGVLRDLPTETDGASFRGWVEDSRADGSMRNDDATLIRIDVFHQPAGSSQQAKETDTAVDARP